MKTNQCTCYEDVCKCFYDNKAGGSICRVCNKYIMHSTPEQCFEVNNKSANLDSLTFGPARYPNQVDYNGDYKVETVNSPDHYNWFDIECLDVVKHFNFNLGSAIKYIWRCEHKGDKTEDLKKAIKCLQNELDGLTEDE